MKRPQASSVWPPRPPRRHRVGRPGRTIGCAASSSRHRYRRWRERGEESPRTHESRRPSSRTPQRLRSRCPERSSTATKRRRRPPRPRRRRAHGRLLLLGGGRSGTAVSVPSARRRSGCSARIRTRRTTTQTLLPCQIRHRPAENRGASRRRTAGTATGTSSSWRGRRRLRPPQRRGRRTRRTTATRGTRVSSRFLRRPKRRRTTKRNRRHGTTLRRPPHCRSRRRRSTTRTIPSRSLPPLPKPTATKETGGRRGRSNGGGAFSSSIAIFPARKADRLPRCYY
mmetsp:Transcript_8872/g.16350  ORF Transcript_8872/g.16350 Transcript_8872/m.16350 type:complete len:283 (+) Transcript_8872:380-1228(+)